MNNMSTKNFDSVFSTAKHLYKIGKVGPAMEALKESINIAKTNEEIGKTLKYWGEITKDSEDALKYYFKSLELFNKSVNPDNDELDEKVSVINKIALIYASNKDYGKAIEYYEKASVILRQLNSFKRGSVVLKNLGKLYTKTNDFVKGLRCHEESLVIARKTDNLMEEARRLKHMGFTYETSGDYSLAKNNYNKSLDIYVNLDNKKGIKRLNILLDELDDLEAQMDEDDYYRGQIDAYGKEDYF